MAEPGGGGHFVVGDGAFRDRFRPFNADLGLAGGPAFEPVDWGNVADDRGGVHLQPALGRPGEDDAGVRVRIQLRAGSRQPVESGGRQAGPSGVLDGVWGLFRRVCCASGGAPVGGNGDDRGIEIPRGCQPALSHRLKDGRG